ncbi:MAG: ferredoxin [Bradymonadia bacterium]|jgi:ferredoxin
MAGILSGSWDWARIKSFGYLAWAFWRRQFKRLIPGRNDDGGAERFLENFSPEGMAPLTAAEETLIQQLGNCIHCGLCEAVCPLPVSRWTAYTRAIAMAADAAQDIPKQCPPECDACVQICPTGVPLAQIPAFVHRHQSGDAS